MTLTFFQNKTERSLTISPEAVRGLRYDHPHWRLFVSDPEPMAVSVFRLPAQTLNAAADYFPRRFNEPLKPFAPKDGGRLLKWLMSETFVEVELEQSAGMPSMFPSGKFAGAKPNLDIQPPGLDK